jgi:hypothetical protein
MADSDQPAAESVANSQSQYDTPERVPHEHELLPCHYFDFFYGASHGGVVATLLGRLRLRVDDATERFHRIHQVFSKCKEVLNEVLPLRKVLRMNRYTKDLENAVYDTATKHPTNPTDRSATDQPFKDPTSVFATSPLFNSDDPRQAQTCVVVPVLIDGVIYQTNHILRTFKCGDEFPPCLLLVGPTSPSVKFCGQSWDLHWGVREDTRPQQFSILPLPCRTLLGMLVRTTGASTEHQVLPEVNAHQHLPPLSHPHASKDQRPAPRHCS